MTSLVAFVGTVIVTRLFLGLSGYPQIRNDALHIAHALWGGLLLSIATLLPLALANRWAIQASALLLLWAMLVIGYIVVLVYGDANIDGQVVQWRGPLLAIPAVTGGLMVVALLAWLSGHGERGLEFAVGGFLLSLVVLQSLYLYISQFSAITATLLQLAFLQRLLVYRRWYL